MSEGIGARFERLVEIMRHLRSPDGCPWDREQTLGTLRRFVLEETYEVLEAIDHDDHDALRDELGDFLFEAVFVAQISAEERRFGIADALDAIIDKLIRRHPHVFGPEAATNPPLSSDRVIERWEEIKAGERGGPKRRTLLSGVPASLPALLRAFELGSRASTVGFDWPSAAPVVDKIEEEVAELKEALAKGDVAHAEEEMGDLLFAIANLSRKLGIEPEAALRLANDKFTCRFETMADNLEAQGRTLAKTSLDELEAEWVRVKATTAIR